MQREINMTTPRVPVRIFGVNGIGLETGNDGVTMGRTLPWLQDTMPPDVWMLWRVNYRDVVILDARNGYLESYNLTDHDLADMANFADLRSRLLAYAR